MAPKKRSALSDVTNTANSRPAKKKQTTLTSWTTQVVKTVTTIQTSIDLTIEDEDTSEPSQGDKQSLDDVENEPPLPPLDDQHLQSILKSNSPLPALIDKYLQPTREDTSSLSSSLVLKDALGGHLAAIIAIARKSGIMKMDVTAINSEKKTKELIQYTLAEHRKSHGRCQCQETMRPPKGIVLDGVASNSNFNSTIDNTKYTLGQKDMLELQEHLDSLVKDQVTDLVLFTISTADGFLTNVFGFVAFFLPYVDKLMSLRLVVCDLKGKSKLYTLQEVFAAIDDIINKGRRGDSSAHLFVQTMITISYNKISQRIGGAGTRLINSTPRNSLVRPDNKTILQRKEHESSALRVIRIVRAGGTDFHRNYIQAEETRWNLRLDEIGHFICPEPGCGIAFASRDAIVCHIIKKILELDEVDQRCPLCPPEYSEWNFASLVHGIYHIRRHISEPEPVSRDGRFAQCPHCFIVYEGVQKAREHMQRQHMMTFEVLFACSKLALCQLSRIWLHDNDASIVVKARQDLKDLGPTFKSLHRYPLMKRRDEVGRLPTGSPLPLTAPFGQPTPQLVEEFSEDVSISSAVEDNEVTAPGASISSAVEDIKITAPDVYGNYSSPLVCNPLPLNSSGQIVCPLQEVIGICGCTHSYKTVADLAKHMGRALRSAAPALIKCPWCPGRVGGTEFGRLSTYANHLRRHFPAEVKCPFCTHRSKSEWDLDSHIAACHPKQFKGKLQHRIPTA